MYFRCCGLDVHKKNITICVPLRDATGRGCQVIRRFETITRELLELADWLQSHQVTYVARERVSVQFTKWK